MARRTATKTAEQPTMTLVAENPSVPAVQQASQQPVATITPAPDSLMAIIERVARDPSVDLDRMQKLIDMHREMKTDNARAEYDAAMSAAQAAMRTIKTNKKNDHTKSSYATYEAMDKAIRPIYTAHGFAMSFNTGDATNKDEVRVLLTISHRGGHRQEYKMDVPADGKGPKGDSVLTKTHAASAAVSYGKRILAGMAWNLSVGDDDDGNSASSIAERAKIMADKGITHLNSLQPATKEALAKWDTENAKAIAWLKKNAPAEFDRYQIAYSNAAQAAGISKEEPKRGDKTKASTAASPHSEPEKDGQPEKEDAAGAGSDSKSEAPSTPAPIEFDTFETARSFLDWSSGWMDDPKRTAAEAEAWHQHFKPKIDEYLQHKFAWIKESMVDTFAQYVKLTSAGG